MVETGKKELVQHFTRKLIDVQTLRLVATQPMWGYKLKKLLEVKFGVRLRHGTLYPLLDRLEKRGLLLSERQRRHGRVRKIYALTAEGKRYLKTYRKLLQDQLSDIDLK